MADPLNLKETLRRRMAEADEGGSQKPPAPVAQAPRFGRQFTPEDKRRHSEALARALRERT